MKNRITNNFNHHYSALNSQKASMTKYLVYGIGAYPMFGFGTWASFAMF